MANNIKPLTLNTQEQNFTNDSFKPSYHQFYGGSHPNQIMYTPDIYPSPTSDRFQEKRLRLDDDTIRPDLVFESNFLETSPMTTPTSPYLSFAKQNMMHDTYTPISPISPKLQVLPLSPTLPSLMHLTQPAGSNFQMINSQRPILPLKRKVIAQLPVPPILPVPNNQTQNLARITPVANQPPVYPKIISDKGKQEWDIIKSIGKGGCGEVFLGREINVRNPELVAIKVIKDRKQFVSEYKTMEHLNNHPHGRGYTPKLIQACKKRKTLIMEYLGDTIAAKFEYSGYRFSLKTIIMLAMRMMNLVRDFNGKTGQAHVDIKPSNLCTSPNGREIYLIDFGYSTSPLVKLPGQTGTPLFMAQNLQTIGATYPTFQDDFESIGYVLMFFIAGGKKGLPWGALRTHKEIAAAKNDTIIHQFCSNLMGTEYEPLMETLSTFLYVTRDRTREFTTEDYNALYQQFANVLAFCGHSFDNVFDWCELDSSRAFSSSVTLTPLEPGNHVNHLKRKAN
ncbi:kinase-like domain-containing protein [Globomyces pollinis-pini]|nr:kinase-like domain-containing protein [Globomyces pollinis-pini]